ncbi:MAG: autotransporter-associated beta strand repeat-containing protein [Opitutaceae bacterium]|nr:autotransporter-associated beta strand repeat-containing protein [Opitutaceae bacterium]
MLTKAGAGQLTLAAAHAYSGGTTVLDGVLAPAVAGALGNGTVTLRGGRLATASLALPNSIRVEGTATISGGHAGGAHAIFAVSGDGVLTLDATNVFDLEGSLSGYAGKVRLAGTGSFRFFGSAGSAAAEFDLGTRSLSARSGAAFALGSLEGAAGSVLSGASGSGNNAAVTYTIGANGRDTLFAGAINNGNASTAVVKTGAGRLVLAGSNNYGGATTVSAGTLLVTGALGATNVSVAGGATFGGGGTLAGNLTLASGARLALGVAPDATRGPAVAGVTTLNGTITIVAESLGGELAPGAYSLLNYAGTLGGTPTFVWQAPAGSPLTARDIAGPEADPDADGWPNLLEYALGGDPLTVGGPPGAPAPEVVDAGLALGFQRIADPALIYEVEASDALGANAVWTVIWSSTGAANTAGPVVVEDNSEAASRPTRFMRLRVRTGP